MAEPGIQEAHEPIVDRPRTFGDLEVVTEESGGAFLLAWIVCLVFLLAALSLMLLEIWKGRGQAGTTQEVEVVDIALGTAEDAVQAPQSDGAATVVSQHRQETPLRVETPQQVTVDRPTGRAAVAPNVDTASAQRIQQEATRDQVAARQGIADLEREIKEAVMNGAGIGGVFKIPDDVKSVVYVLDCSGSMSGPPLQAVKSELLTALRSMKPHVRFFVYFYSDTPIPLSVASGGESLVEATPTNVKQAEEWIRVTDQGGGTQPISPMERAIDLKPELIFLLSDGQFSPHESEAIVNYNARIRKGARIHCVGVSEEVLDTMKTIADRTGGVYYRARQSGNALSPRP